MAGDEQEENRLLPQSEHVQDSVASLGGSLKCSRCEECLVMCHSVWDYHRKKNDQQSCLLKSSESGGSVTMETLGVIGKYG